MFGHKKSNLKLWSTFVLCWCIVGVVSRPEKDANLQQDSKGGEDYNQKLKAMFQLRKSLILPSLKRLGKASSGFDKEEQKDEDPKLEAGVSALARAMLAHREQMKNQKNSPEVKIDRRSCNQ